MEGENKQITSRLLMIRPANFGYNDETAENNAFQHSAGQGSLREIQEKALEEFDRFVSTLRSHGVHVDVIEDQKVPMRPDAIFPNNWISMHQDGALITYPMYSSKRRQERREDILEWLEQRYEVSRRYSFEFSEEQDEFLEGTGSMILDRQYHIVYACLSPRTHIEALDRFCLLRGFERVDFRAQYKSKEIYHTNVLMALGTGFVVCCMDAINEEADRKRLESIFERTSKVLIEISLSQMASFAGNMLQVMGSGGESLIVMSTQAFRSLDERQKRDLGRYGKLVHSPLDTIEYYGGGSARCMMAENFLPLSSAGQLPERG